MDDLCEQIETLRQHWTELREDYLTEDICKSYIPGITLAQLDEVVTIVCDFLDRAKAPKEFAPTFNLARALASGDVDSANTIAKQIKAGMHTQLPSFVNAINQTLTAFHSLLVYGDKHDFTSDLTMQLQESLTLLDTAQKELAQKLHHLNASAAIENELKEAADEMDALSERANTAMEAITNAGVQTSAELKGVKEDREEIDNTKAESEKLLGLLQNLRGKLQESEKQLDDLQSRSKVQLELINELLPNAASAGLAHAFSREQTS